MSLQCVNCIREDVRKQWNNLCDCLIINSPDGLQTITIKLLCDILKSLLYCH